MFSSLFTFDHEYQLYYSIIRFFLSAAFLDVVVPLLHMTITLCVPSSFPFSSFAVRCVYVCLARHDCHFPFVFSPSLCLCTNTYTHTYRHMRTDACKPSHPTLHGSLSLSLLFLSFFFLVVCRPVIFFFVLCWLILFLTLLLLLLVRLL